MATILIVEYARSTLRALEVILKREGTVLTAASGTIGAHSHRATRGGCSAVRRENAQNGRAEGAAAGKSPGRGHCCGDDVGHGDISTAVAAMKEGAFTTSSNHLAKMRYPSGAESAGHACPRGGEPAPETPGP